MVDSWVLTRDKKDIPKNNRNKNGNNVKKIELQPISTATKSIKQYLYSTPIILVDDEKDLLISF